MHELLADIWKDPFKYAFGCIMIVIAAKLVISFIRD